MATSSATLHEDKAGLESTTVDQHRAIVSLMEELEAVDWYSQRVDVAGSDELRAILAHNRDEEIEHASMVIEWLRRNNSTFDKFLKDYLFTDKPIVGIEETNAEERGSPLNHSGSLGIGCLKEWVAR